MCEELTDEKWEQSVKKDKKAMIIVLFREGDKKDELWKNFWKVEAQAHKNLKFYKVIMQGEKGKIIAKDLEVEKFPCIVIRDRCKVLERIYGWDKEAIESATQCLDCYPGTYEKDVERFRNYWKGLKASGGGSSKPDAKDFKRSQSPSKDPKKGSDQKDSKDPKKGASPSKDGKDSKKASDKK